jgi:hypothetical protein
MQPTNGNLDFATGNAAPAAGPYADLAQHLAAGGVSVLVGAELSVAAGLPSWYDILAELGAQIDYTGLPPRQWASGGQLIDAAQAYVNRRGLHSLLSHLKQRLDTTRVRPSAAHHALARLPVSLVFTANLDDLLERAFRESGRQVEVVTRDSSIPFMGRGPGTVNIVKLYGSLDQPDTVVLTKAQCGAYPAQRPHTIGLVQNALATTDMLYVGWGGANPDPYFDQLFGQLLSSLGQMMRPGYAVTFGATEAQREEFRRRQIRLVELPAGDPAARLAAWLESLAPAAAAAPPLTRPATAKGDDSPAAAVRLVLNSGKAWAVLAGVNHYEDAPHIPDLRVCAADVTAIHAALAPSYTAARLLTDDTAPRLPTRANILSELSSVAQAAEAGDLLLFYFSGHGVAFGGESYLLPRDAKLAALRHTTVAMRDVREIVEASPARAKVLVLDACHGGAAIGKAGPAMTPEFIQRVFSEAEGMAVLASCQQGQQSWEWRREGRSVFTHFLLEALRGAADFDGKGFVTVSDASRYVVDRVKLWAVEHSRPQTPTLQVTVAGDIVLARTGAVSAAPVPPPLT